MLIKHRDNLINILNIAQVCNKPITINKNSDDIILSDTEYNVMIKTMNGKYYYNHFKDKDKVL